MLAAATARVAAARTAGARPAAQPPARPAPSPACRRGRSFRIRICDVGGAARILEPWHAVSEELLLPLVGHVAADEGSTHPGETERRSDDRRPPLEHCPPHDRPLKSATPRLSRTHAPDATSSDATGTSARAPEAGAAGVRPDDTPRTTWRRGQTRRRGATEAERESWTQRREDAGAQLRWGRSTSPRSVLGGRPGRPGEPCGLLATIADRGWRAP